jgi:hypothetical protein
MFAIIRKIRYGMKQELRLEQKLIITPSNY